MIYHGTTPVDTLYIHCAATRPNWMEGHSSQAKYNEIRRWHVEENGWNDFAYHRMIDRDGTKIDGRPLTTQGAHVGPAHNRGSLGVVLVGGHGSSSTDDFDDHFTPEQNQALVETIMEWRQHAPLPNIRGHNEVANKACPGFQVKKWVASQGDRNRSRPRPPRTLAEILTNLLRAIFGGNR